MSLLACLLFEGLFVKLPPNSLFAILLRSPWWFSALLVVGFVLLSRLLLSDDYWQFGAMGAFPFVVTAALSLKRQLKTPKVSTITTQIETLRNMAWPAFSEKIVQSLTQQGYTIAKLESASGADFLISKQDQKIVVAAKRWKAANLGESELHQLNKAKQFHKANGAWYITVGNVSNKAVLFANKNQIELLQDALLVQRLPLV